MSYQLHSALNLAKAIHADIGAAGGGEAKASAYTYTIAGVTINTERPLPEEVQAYIAAWAKDPIWDIDDADPEIKEYAPELMAYAKGFEAAHASAWEVKVKNVTNLRAAKVDFLEGNFAAVHARMAIIQAEELRFIRELLEDGSGRSEFAESISIWKGSE